VGGPDRPLVFDALSILAKPELNPEAIEIMLDAGVSAIHASLDYTGQAPLEEILDRVASWLRAFDEGHPQVMPVSSVADIRAAHEAGRLGIVLGFQSPWSLEGHPDYLHLFTRLGVRVIQLTYQQANGFGDGCEELRNAGLSNAGRDLVKRMNDLGVLVDLSHCGERTTLEAIEASERPVAITHSNPRALHDHMRNKSDQVIRALAERGGVIGVSVLTSLLSKGYQTQVRDLADVIDYVSALAGAEHVGLGFDFAPSHLYSDYLFWKAANPVASAGVEWSQRYPEAMQDAEARGTMSRGLIRQIAAELKDRGWAPSDIAGVLGENFLRLLAEVWEPAEGAGAKRP
jgi:membrane dipeptidase